MMKWTIAHRGSSGTYPENTKSAFLEALRIGVDAIELDVQLTKDNEIVVHHDATLIRTGKKWSLIKKNTVQQLKKLNFGNKKVPEQILTLKEALELIGDKCNVLIEPKETFFNHERLIVEEVNQFKHKNKLWMHSRDWRIIRNIRKCDPNIKMGFIDIIPTFHILNIRRYLNLAKKYDISFFSLHHFFINRYFLNSYIKKLRRNSIESYVWVVNNEKDMRKIISWQADAVITNYPSKFKKILQETKI
jgi:glycerophosphoryl diester phosphodiesterase